MAYKIRTYKNMEIGKEFNLVCKPKDKEMEKEKMKRLRKKYYEEIRKLRKIDKPTLEETNRLLDLEDQFRDAKKPQMNEAMFYGFEDIQDEYNYGRDIYKEDIYETHQNLVIPYKRKQLYHIPHNPFEDVFETLDGYYKLGKLTENLIKFNVKVEFKNNETKDTTDNQLMISPNKQII